MGNMGTRRVRARANGAAANGANGANGAAARPESPVSSTDLQLTPEEVQEDHVVWMFVSRMLEQQFNRENAGN